MNYKLTVICASLVASSSLTQAAFIIDVTGGILGNPLSIDIIQGDTFLTTAPSNSTTIALVFEDLWDNFSTSNTSSFATDTIAATGATRSSTTGALNFNGISLADLTVAFIFPSPGTSSGQSITVSSGTRTTSGNLNLLYSAINSSGNARLYSGDSGTAISAPIAYTIVPEPASTTLSGLGLLSLALIRKRRSR